MFKKFDLLKKQILKFYIQQADAYFATLTDLLKEAYSGYADGNKVEFIDKLSGIMNDSDSILYTTFYKLFEMTDEQRDVFTEYGDATISTAFSNLGLALNKFMVTLNSVHKETDPADKNQIILAQASKIQAFDKLFVDNLPTEQPLNYIVTNADGSAVATLLSDFGDYLDDLKDIMARLNEF